MELLEERDSWSCLDNTLEDDVGCGLVPRVWSLLVTNVTSLIIFDFSKVHKAIIFISFENLPSSLKLGSKNLERLRSLFFEL